MSTPTTADKATFYKNLLKKVQVFTDSTRDPWANMSNVASLIYRHFQKTYGVDSINWAGFYLIREKYGYEHKEKNEPHENQVLILGPFHGEAAVQVIGYGKGVCGTAWQQRLTQLIPDVHQCENHIACDSRSQSEIVVPLFADAEHKHIIGVLDMDSPVVNGFSTEDQTHLESLVEYLRTSSDWDAILKTSVTLNHADAEDGLCPSRAH